MEGSNLRPPRCERGALTTELTAPYLWDNVNYRHRHAHVQLKQRPFNCKQSGTNVAGKPTVTLWELADINSSPWSNCLVGTRSKILMIGDDKDSYLEVAAGVNLYMI